MKAVLLMAALALVGAACVGDASSPSTTSTESTTSTVAATTSTTVQLPTAAEIIADGEVTNEERELARRAVFECIVEAGADTTFEMFDLDPVVQRDYPDAFQDCHVAYVGLSRRNQHLDDDFALYLLGVVECTEDATGDYYGPKTVDQIGRLTDESRDTIYEAVNTKPLAWDKCHKQLLADDRTWTSAEIVGYKFDGEDPSRIFIQLASCGYLYDAYLISETRTTVRVWASADEGNEPCWTRHPIRLKDPLADRTLVNHETGDTITQTSP